MWKSRGGRFAFALGVIVVFVIVDVLVFRWLLDRSYVDWFMQQASFIGLTVSVVAVVWKDVDRNTGLVSADPRLYLGAAFYAVGVPLSALGTELRSARADQNVLSSLADTILTVTWMAILFVTLITWLVVIAPAQYLAFLVCAAPSRRFLGATTRPIASDADGTMRIRATPVNEKVPDGWWDAGFREKPVALANLCMSLFFFLLSLKMK